MKTLQTIWHTKFHYIVTFFTDFQYQSIKISWSIPVFMDWLCWGFWCMQNCNIILNRPPWSRVETDGWCRCQVAGYYEVASFIQPIPQSSHKMNFYARPVSKHNKYLAECVVQIVTLVPESVIIVWLSLVRLSGQNLVFVLPGIFIRN